MVVNFNGKQFLDDCLGSLFSQTYPADRIEVVVVDNGSSDGSVEHLKQNWPQAVVAPLKENLGFAGGVNEGVRRAGGQWIALINNDARADPQWVHRGLEAFNKSSNVGMVGSKILSLDGNFIDYAGGALSFYGHGFKIGVDEKDFGQYDRGGETLFASGCALFMPRRLFLQAGGFDDDFFAFFEDVDLGWRLWTMGYRILYEPSSLVYHRHHGTAAGMSRDKERFLLERNALLTMIKNFEAPNLNRLLPAALMLSLERGMPHSQLTSERYDLARHATDPLPEEEKISTRTAAHILGISEAARMMPGTLEKRRVVQERRKRSDREIVSLFTAPLTSNYGAPGFMKTYDSMLEAFQVREVFEGRTKVLLITADTVSQKMAGPAIRAWEMCSELARKHEVTMLAKAATNVVPKGFKLDLLKEKTLGGYLDWADVIVFQGFIMH
ncbi:MAG: glycosyltransferase family 2 protein, partial [Actinomycetota bacterium]